VAKACVALIYVAAIRSLTGLGISYIITELYIVATIYVSLPVFTVAKAEIPLNNMNKM